MVVLWCLFSSEAFGAEAEDRLNARWAGRLLRSLESHPRLVAGRATKDLAEAKIETARQPIYEPQLALEWKQRGNQSAGSNFEVFLAQKLDLAGKSDARTRIMESASEASRADYRALREELLQTILNSVGEKWMAARSLEIAEKTRSTAEDFVHLLEKHERAGRVSLHEVDHAYLRLADTVRMVAEAEANLVQSDFRLASLIGDARVPDHLPLDTLGAIRPLEDIENKVRSLARVAAARWRFESSRAGLDAVDAERQIDPTLGLLGGKDENDNFIGAVVILPLALRASNKPFHEVSSQAALIDEQNYLEAFRLAESRLRTAGAVYGKLYARWKEWHALTAGRTDLREGLLRRLWDSGEISSLDFLSLLKERADAGVTGMRLTLRVWMAWTEWLASSEEMEAWLRRLAGFDEPGTRQ